MNVDVSSNFICRLQKSLRGSVVLPRPLRLSLALVCLPKGGEICREHCINTFLALLDLHYFELYLDCAEWACAFPGVRRHFACVSVKTVCIATRITLASRCVFYLAESKLTRQERLLIALLSSFYEKITTRQKVT